VKILLLTVALAAMSTPALAMPDPVGCFTHVEGPEDMVKHPKQLVTMVRLNIKKSAPRSEWNWDFALHVILRGQDIDVMNPDILKTTGGCMPTRAPGSMRCYIAPQPDGGRLIFTPRGREVTMYLDDQSITMGEKQVFLSKADDALKLNRANPSICKGM